MDKKYAHFYHFVAADLPTLILLYFFCLYLHRPRRCGASQVSPDNNGSHLVGSLPFQATKPFHLCYVYFTCSLFLFNEIRSFLLASKESLNRVTADYACFNSEMGLGVLCYCVYQCFLEYLGVR